MTICCTGGYTNNLICLQCVLIYDNPNNNSDINHDDNPNNPNNPHNSDDRFSSIAYSNIGEGSENNHRSDDPDNAIVILNKSEEHNSSNICFEDLYIQKMTMAGKMSVNDFKNKVRGSQAKSIDPVALSERLAGNPNNPEY